MIRPVAAGGTISPSRDIEAVNVTQKGRRAEALSSRIRSLVRAIQENDEARIEAAVLRLSRSRRAFSPLAFAVSAVVVLYQGLRLLLTNWRLMLVQVLPAMWIWISMFDLKLHVLRGESFNVVRGPILIPIALVMIAITIGCLFLNSVFAFAVARPGPPEIRPAVHDARKHVGPIVATGVVLGGLLAFSTVIVTRWGRPWFTISLGITVALMMVLYVALPARMIGVERSQSRSDRMWTSIVSGAISITVCTPPYALGRIGILMLGSRALLIPGLLLLAVAIPLQAGATGAVSALKMSVSLTPARREAA
jgi:hypothetical protein